MAAGDDGARDLLVVGQALRLRLDAGGGIDVAANTVRAGREGAVAETSDARARAIFDLNACGPLNALHAAPPHLRRQQAGRMPIFGAAGGPARR